jgi:hypothetical protein
MSGLVTAVDFLGNFTRFALPHNDPPASPVARSVRTAIARFVKPREASLFSSTIVLFHTLSDDATDWPPIFETFPAATFRASGALSPFASILEGKHYLPPCEYDKRVIGLAWAPSDRDTSLAEQMFDPIIANPQKVSVCQKELASFFPENGKCEP